MEFGDNHTVSDLIITGAKEGVRIKKGDNCVVTGNTITGVTGGRGIRVEHGLAPIVTGNIVTGSKKENIRVRNAAGAVADECDRVALIDAEAEGIGIVAGKVGNVEAERLIARTTVDVDQELSRIGIRVSLDGRAAGGARGHGPPGDDPRRHGGPRLRHPCS